MVSNVIDPWVQQAVSRMQNARLNIYGRYRQDPLDVRESVAHTAQILSRGHTLRSLRINFVNRMLVCYSDFEGGATPGRHLNDLIVASARKEHRARERNVLKAWPMAEVYALEPLRDVRGVENVLVLGSVTNRW